MRQRHSQNSREIGPGLTDRPRFAGDADRGVPLCAATDMSAQLRCLIQENHSLNLEKHEVDGELWHRNQRLRRQLGAEHPRHVLG